MRPHRWRLALALFSSSVLAGAPQHLPRQPACLVTSDHMIPIQVEVAMSPDERQIGLMERPFLPATAGMLFRYPESQAATRGFWMYRTRLPLDIAYLNEAGVIVSLHQMTPCPPKKGRRCPRYPSGRPFSAVLEMNEGFFGAHEVDVGDQLLPPMTPPREHACPSSRHATPRGSSAQD
ncbi:hypothetical protein CF392_06060 [Tamilnaduibacter salinus]|uniref:DUF192 domain-containing protein n=1 Tax=Tamilnaduibacter salinus TaxID=1484056 RepID=A0A2A2I5I6_9GAMM|nr:hypothetical protein CF392_06060 [Tamilnaduibacter salinus]